MKHRSYLVWEKHVMEHKYAQLLVYLNSGIFTISTVLVNTYKISDYSFLLLISWGCALFSLIFILISFQSSIKSFKVEIDSWDKNRKASLCNCYLIATKILTSLSTVLLTSALILLFIFFSFNFYFMNNSETKTYVEGTPINMQKNSEPETSGPSPTEFFVTPPTQKN